MFASIFGNFFPLLVFLAFRLLNWQEIFPESLFWVELIVIPLSLIPQFIFAPRNGNFTFNGGSNFLSLIYMGIAFIWAVELGYQGIETRSMMPFGVYLLSPGIPLLLFGLANLIDDFWTDTFSIVLGLLILGSAFLIPALIIEPYNPGTFIPGFPFDDTHWKISFFVRGMGLTAAILMAMFLRYPRLYFIFGGSKFFHAMWRRTSGLKSKLNKKLAYFGRHDRKDALKELADFPRMFSIPNLFLSWKEVKEKRGILNRIENLQKSIAQKAGLVLWEIPAPVCPKCNLRSGQEDRFGVKIAVCPKCKNEDRLALGVQKMTARLGEFDAPPGHTFAGIPPWDAKNRVANDVDFDSLEIGDPARGLDMDFALTAIVARWLNQHPEAADRPEIVMIGKPRLSENTLRMLRDFVTNPGELDKL